jgi:hypothetical protein
VEGLGWLEVANIPHSHTTRALTQNLDAPYTGLATPDPTEQVLIAPSSDILSSILTNQLRDLLLRLDHDWFPVFLPKWSPVAVARKSLMHKSHDPESKFWKLMFILSEEHKYLIGIGSLRAAFLLAGENTSF